MLLLDRSSAMRDDNTTAMRSSGLGNDEVGPVLTRGSRLLQQQKDFFLKKTMQKVSVHEILDIQKMHESLKNIKRELQLIAKNREKDEKIEEQKDEDCTKLPTKRK